MFSLLFSLLIIHRSLSKRPDNDNLRDLLVSGRGDHPKLDLLNTMPSGNNVKNVEQIQVTHQEQVIEIMAHGSKNRACAETNMNERSSRLA